MKTARLTAFSRSKTLRLVLFFFFLRSTLRVASPLIFVKEPALDPAIEPSQESFFVC